MGPPRRSDHRVLISGLPPTGSWQDLKDHMREAGDVLYTDVFKDGSGVVEFARKDDMKWAIRNLDDTKFRSHEVYCSIVFVSFSMLSAFDILQQCKFLCIHCYDYFNCHLMLPLSFFIYSAF